MAESATHAALPKNKIKAAFTLAEVLITLGIIGVVVALTIPTLVQSYRKSVVETKLAKFYSVMNQAIQLAEIDYGETKYWGAYKNKITETEDGKSYIIADREFFDKYFTPYLKNVEVKSVAGTDGIFTEVDFADGSVAIFSENSIGYFIDKKDVEKLINYSNRYDSTRIIGTKAFDFFFDPLSGKGVETYLSQNVFPNCCDDEQLRNHVQVGCNSSATVEPAYCTEIIRRNGWKIPKDYPFKF